MFGPRPEGVPLIGELSGGIKITSSRDDRGTVEKCLFFHFGTTTGSFRCALSEKSPDLKS